MTRNLDTKLANKQNNFMKTTVDLPEALVHEIKLHAVNKRQKLEDAVAELLRTALAASADAADLLVRPVVKTHPKTGLPYLECPHAASPDEEMTPERVAELLLQQEVTWHHEAG